MDQKPQKVHKLFVGYRTRPIAGIEKYMPEFKAPSNFKDEAKIKAEIQDRKDAFLAAAKDMPYSGTFDEVVLIDKARPKVVRYSYAAADDEKLPVSVRVRNYLLKHYPTAWGTDTHNRGLPAVVIVGFDPRTFLKILGLECSLPSVGKPCPLGLWYTNTDHRDIAEAVMPKEFKGLTLPYVLKFRRPVSPPAAVQNWDELLKDWPGPGTHPNRDALIAAELASQLGFLSDD